MRSFKRFWLKHLARSSLALLALNACTMSARSDCLDPIAVPSNKYTELADKVQDLYLRFHKVDDEVCIPLTDGTCNKRMITRVSIDLDAGIRGSFMVGQYTSLVRQKQADVCGNVPSFLFGDCAFSRIDANIADATSMNGNFDLHLEKWASGDWICCQWLQCHHCEWKTRLWERTFSGNTIMTLNYSPDMRNVSMNGHTNVDTSLTPIEHILTGVATSLLGGDFFVGAVFAEPIFKNILPMLNLDLPDQRAGFPNILPSTFDEIKDLTIRAEVQNYFNNDKMVYKKDQSILLSLPDGSFVFRDVRGRDDASAEDRRAMPAYVDFCSVIRPTLENEFLAAPPLAPSPPTKVFDVGQLSENYTVKAGDNLWSVPKAHYGDPRYFHVLQISGYNKLRVGQNVVLPSFREISQAGYMIAQGDSLWSISKHVYGRGSRYTELVESNPRVARSPDKIFPIFVLTVPR